MTRDEKIQKFINANRLEILKLCIKNRDKIGYARVFADLDFNPIGETEFVEGKFTKKHFHFLNGNVEPSNPEKVKDAFYIYYSINWVDDETTLNIKELILASEL